MRKPGFKIPKRPNVDSQIDETSELMEAPSVPNDNCEELKGAEGQPPAPRPPPRQIFFVLEQVPTRQKATLRDSQGPDGFRASAFQNSVWGLQNNTTQRMRAPEKRWRAPEHGLMRAPEQRRRAPEQSLRAPDQRLTALWAPDQRLRAPEQRSHNRS